MTREEVKILYQKITGRGRCDKCDTRRKLFEKDDQRWCYECIVEFDNL